MTASEDNSNLRTEQFKSLTMRGQYYYADRITEGAKHEEAFKDARFSYGVKT